MKSIRKYLTALLALMFAAVIMVSILYFPDNRDLVYKALPAEVDFISVHSDFAARARELIENNIFRSLVTSIGVEAEQIDYLFSDPDGRDWLERIAGDMVVIGHVPPGIFSPRSSWGLAAWIGADSLRLRWQLDFTAPRETRVGDVAGTRVWRFDLPDLPLGQKLYCAVKEGVLLLALSDSAAMMQNMILASQGRAVSALDTHSEWHQPGTDELENRPDMFWLLDRDGWTGGMKLEFDSVTASHMRGNLRFLDHESVGLSTPAQGLRTVTSPWREPMAYALLDRVSLLEITQYFERNIVRDIVEYMTDALDAESVFLGLFGEDKQGRLMGFRIPGALMAIPVADAEKALQSVMSCIDYINSSYSLGIIHNRVSVDDHDIYYVEGTRDNLYGRLPANEQIVVAHKDGYLFIASHHILIDSIIAGDFFLDGADELRRMVQGTATPYSWIDLERSSSAVNLILAVQRLRLIAENPRDFVDIRRRFDLVRDWVEVFSNYGEALLWSPTDRHETYLEFEIGREHTSP